MDIYTMLIQSLKAFSGTSCARVSWFAVTPDVRFLVYISQVRYKIQTSPVAQMVKCLPAMWETWVRFLGREYSLEKEMAIHSSILAWKIPWTEEPGRLQSTGSQRVGHDWTTSLIFIPRASLVAQLVKYLPAMQEIHIWSLDIQVPSLGQEDPLEEEMATHSRTLAWKTRWTEEPGSHSP